MKTIACLAVGLAAVLAGAAATSRRNSEHSCQVLCGNLPTGVHTPISKEPAAYQDRYYMTLFAWQGGRNDHTWATFCRVDEADNMDERTISWLPQYHKATLLDRPEPGHNLDLRDTLDMAKNMSVDVRRFGPHPIDKTLFDMAVVQIDRLNSGHVQYKTADRKQRGLTCNCVHAVADVDASGGYLLTRAAYGYDATAVVKKHLKRWILSGEDAEWVAWKLQVAHIKRID